MFFVKLYALAAMLITVAFALSCHQRTRNVPSLEIRVYSIGNQGFGYALYQGDKKILDQPYIPAVQHLAPFRSHAEAESVAELVKGKFQSLQFPPSVTINELDSLRIRY